MMDALRKIVTVSCTVLAFLLFGVTALIAVQGPVSAGRTGNPVAMEANDIPFDFEISPEPPDSVRGVNKVDIRQAVRLSAGEIVLDHYDVYYTDRKDPFTVWVVFKSVDLDRIAELNGEAFASEATTPYVEVYLSFQEGLTFAGDGSETDGVSPFVRLADVQPFGRN